MPVPSAATCACCRALAHPGKVLGVATIIFVATMALVPMLGADLIPQLAQDRFEMTVKLPAGTPLKQTDALVRELQLAHGKGEGVASLYGVSGSGTRLDASPTESGENIGKLTVVMEGGGNAHTEAAITERLRGTMGQHPGAQVDFARPALFSFSTPLEIELRGQDMATLEVAGQRLAAMLRGNAHYADVKSTVEEGFPEIQIRFDQERAGALGLTTRQIADVVVKKVRGDVATRYSFRDRKIDVLVRAQEGDRASVESIRRLIVNPGSTRPVTLDAVADVVATTGPSEIHRADQTRVAVVSANLRDIDLGAAMREVQQMVAEQPLGAGVGLHIGGQGEELAQAAKSLIFAFGLAIFLVYLVMASQFESLLHPFVILFTIPLALVGAILALMLTGKPISVVVFIGLILLVGLVTKNAIILIDKVNQLREAGVAKHEALVEGARSRLRPIIMTTLCTLFGFLPLAVAMGEGAEVRAPMAITVIGGLLVSTLLTLLVIPVVYDLMDRRGDAYYRERGRKHAGERAGRRGRRGGCGGTGMSVAEFSIRRPVTTIMCFVSLVVIGLIASFRLPLEALPDISAPFLFVQIPYTGSTPEEVERTIIRPVEESLATMTGIKRMRSSATSEAALIFIEFSDWDRDIAIAAVRCARAHRRDPQRPARRPAALQRVQVVQQRPAGAEGAPGQHHRPDHRLRHARPRVQAAHRAHPGVARVDITGAPPNEVEIAIDPNRLNAHGLSINELSERLRTLNFSISAGQIDDNGQRVRVQPVGEITDLQEMRDLVINAKGLRLGDIADVRLKPARMNYGRRLDGNPAVGLDIFKERSANLVEVSRAALAEVEAIRAQPSMRDVQIKVIDNQGKAVTSSLLELAEAGAVGLILSVTVLFFFLRHWPSTLMVTLAIPICFTITLGFMYFVGVTLNILTMMGLLLAVGMLVDNAVVVVESIYQERERMPGSRGWPRSSAPATWPSRSAPARCATASCSCRTCSARPTTSASSWRRSRSPSRSRCWPRGWWRSA
jgi:multidrug efflux pump subunit AcrB